MSTLSEFQDATNLDRIPPLVGIILTALLTVFVAAALSTIVIL